MGAHPIQFADALTLSRTSSKYVTDATGTVVQVASGAAAFDHDPISHAPLGLSIEEADSNLALNSDAPATALTLLTGVTLTANAAASPDGASAAAQIAETSANSVHAAAANITVADSTQEHVFMLWVKRGTRRYVGLKIAEQPTTANYVLATFDLINGSVVAKTAGGTGAGTVAFIRAYPNSYFLIGVHGNPTTTPGAQLRITFEMFSDSLAGTYAGDSSENAFLWRLMFYQGHQFTTPIPTTSAPVTRAADSVEGVSPLYWFNPVEGTAIVDFFLPAIAPNFAGRTQAIVRFDDGTAHNSIVLRNTSGTANIDLVVTDASVVTLSATLGVIASPVRARAAFSYGNDTIAGSLNGGAPVIGAIGKGVPTGLARFIMGSADGLGLYALNGSVLSFRYFDRRFDAADLALLSALPGTGNSATPASTAPLDVFELDQNALA